MCLHGDNEVLRVNRECFDLIEEVKLKKAERIAIVPPWQDWRQSGISSGERKKVISQNRPSLLILAWRGLAGSFKSSSEMGI